MLDNRLSASFYLNDNVLEVAPALLGKILITQIDGILTSGRITEVEAYRAPDDRASHAWNNRRTPRTDVMFRGGGTAYVYLCYGIHHLFNVVTGPENMAHAVLIRGIEPLEGIEYMLARRKMNALKPALSNGPGALSQALGLSTKLTGQNMLAPDTPVWICEAPAGAPSFEIETGKRIGVDYAGECAEWPWRFWVKGSRWAK